MMVNKNNKRKLYEYCKGFEPLNVRKAENCLAIFLTTCGVVVACRTFKQDIFSGIRAYSETSDEESM